MKTSYNYLLLALLTGTLITGCKKDKGPTSKFDVAGDTAYVGDSISFTNSSSNATDYLWNFGDGASSSEENPKHVYSKSGTYNVVLKAYGSSGTDESSLSLKVVSPNTILDGQGIKNVSFGDTWSQVDALYPNEKVSYGGRYDSTSGWYDLSAYYYEKGVEFVFFSDDSLLDNQDFVYFIIVNRNFIGSSNKGISLDDKMSDVLSAYGVPDQKDQQTSYLGYYYAAGIYFESDTPPSFPTVEYIIVFPVSGNSASRSGANSSGVKEMIGKNLHQLAIKHFNRTD